MAPFDIRSGDLVAQLRPDLGGAVGKLTSGRRHSHGYFARRCSNEFISRRQGLIEQEHKTTRSISRLSRLGFINLYSLGKVHNLVPNVEKFLEF
jgi:hypothetical protein